jgi:hypothetical protein
MKRAAAYVLVVLAWVILAFAVGVAVSVPIQLVRHFKDLVLWRVALLGLIAIAVGIACVLIIRWARSTLGKRGGSRAGRIVFGIALILFGFGVMNPSDPNLTEVGRDGAKAAGAGIALFGAALTLEAAWWHRASRSSTRAPLPDAPTAGPESTPPSEITLPEPPPVHDP